jgi:hypothetical protein
MRTLTKSRQLRRISFTQSTYPSGPYWLGVRKKAGGGTKGERVVPPPTFLRACLEEWESRRASLRSNVGGI